MSNRAPGRAAAAAVAILLFVGAAPQQPAKQDVDGIRNFTRVDATVACAGATSVEAIAGLKREGFVSIINLRQASERGVDIEASRGAADAAGLNYIHLPFDSSAPNPDVATEFLAAVANRANQPVFVHCGSANRVGALWLIKRVMKDGWTIAQATEEAKAIGLRSEKLEAFALKYLADNDGERRRAPGLPSFARPRPGA